MLVVIPAFIGSEYVGASVSLRSTAELRIAEDSAILHQMNYQVLFDSLPIGAAVFRPAVAADGGPDGYIVEANAALKKTTEGIPLPYTEPCSVVWPSFARQEKLRDGISQVASGALNAKCEFFSPALGKHLDVSLAPLPGGRVLAMVADQTDARIHEKQVLELNDQLHRTIAHQSDFIAKLIDDVQHFNQATADIVECHLEQISQLLPQLPDAAAPLIADALAALYRTLHQMLRYHNVANLPFKELSLVYPAEIVTRLVESLSNRYPDITFHVGSLPAVVASQEVLASILEQLVAMLARLPVTAAPARVEVGSQANFLDTTLYVAGWGFDTEQLFIEIPEEKQSLDWTHTSDLDMAPVRRMVTKHGGDLCIAQTEDRLGVQLSFTIGAPTSPT